MSPKFYLTVLKAGVLSSFFIFFFVFKDLLFPYITSKQLPFNILVEILMIFWVALIVKYPEYLPKKNYIGFGLIAFVIAIFISAVHGVDFNLSFWGDIERMLGVFHTAHFVAFYFIIITAFRDKADWMLLFGTALVVSFIIAVDILMTPAGQTPYGTIGNTAYVAGLMIFAMYFSLFFVFQVKNWALRILLSLPLLVLFPAFWKLGNSGGTAGIGVGILLFLFLLGVFNKNYKIKITTLSVFAIFAIFLSLIFINKNSEFVKGNNYLNVLTSRLSSNKITFQTRLISWRGAIKDFKNHPILGTGFGNYAIIFDKNFNPKFYDYMKSETYFDRAHNNIIDIASTSGLIGISAYLSIFIFTFYYLIKSYRENKIELKIFAWLVSLITAYFIYNLAIFDSFVTYVSIMVVLGYIYWATENDKRFANELGFNDKEFTALGIAGIFFLFVSYQYNIKPWEMLHWTIEGQKAYASQDLIATTDAYKKALSYNTGLDRDSRTTYIRTITQNPSLLNKLDKEKAKEILDYAIYLGNKNLDYNKKDSLEQMEMAQLYSVAASFYYNDREKYSYYLDLSLESIDKSIEASPGRTTIYFTKAQILLSAGKKDEAIQALKYAAELNPRYGDSYCQLSKVYNYYKDDKNSFFMMDKCLDNNGADSLYPDNFYKTIVDHYVKNNDWNRLLILHQRLAGLNPQDANVHVSLAKIYAKLGQFEDAKASALKAAEVNPQFKEGAEKFIESLKK